VGPGQETAGPLHEAGYDSYVTAFAFAYIRLVTELQTASQEREATTEIEEEGPGAGAQPALAPLEHLAESKNVLPLYRSLYPGVCVEPGSEDGVEGKRGEQLFVLNGFPTAYQTSDVVRLLTTAAPSSSTSSSSSSSTAQQEGENKGDKPKVNVRWINDDSVVARFADGDAATVFANVDGHRASAAAAAAAAGVGGAEKAMLMTPLGAFMRATDAEEDATSSNAAAAAGAGESHQGEGPKRAAAPLDTGAAAGVSPAKKPKPGSK